jgi:hypothetical protein
VTNTVAQQEGMPEDLMQRALPQRDIVVTSDNDSNKNDEEG